MVDADMLERRVAAAVRSWLDSFKTSLLARFDEAYALQLFDKYAQAFPAAYTEDFSADDAALDVSFLEAMEKEPARLHLDIYRPDPKRKEKLFLKIFRGQDAIPISDLLPMLENMGLKVIAERPYELDFSGGRRAWIQDLELLMQASPAIAFDALDREIKNAITAVWTGRMDSDSFNQLTLSAGIPWRMVTVLRAAAREVKVPTLLVRGADSDVVSDAGVAAFRELMPHVEVFDVAQAGHMVAGDSNDAFNGAVLEFLARQFAVGGR